MLELTAPHIAISLHWHQAEVFQTVNVLWRYWSRSTPCFLQFCSLMHVQLCLHRSHASKGLSLMRSSLHSWKTGMETRSCCNVSNVDASGGVIVHSEGLRRLSTLSWRGIARSLCHLRWPGVLLAWTSRVVVAHFSDLHAHDSALTSTFFKLAYSPIAAHAQLQFNTACKLW